MIGKTIRSHGLLSLTLLAVALVALVSWYSGISLGQQVSPGQQVRTPGTRLQMSGNLHIRLNLPEGPNDREPLKYFENATRLVIQDDWAFIWLREEKDEAALVVPRERVVFIKAWEVPEEKAE